MLPGGVWNVIPVNADGPWSLPEFIGGANLFYPDVNYNASWQEKNCYIALSRPAQVKLYKQGVRVDIQAVFPQLALDMAELSRLKCYIALI